MLHISLSNMRSYFLNFFMNFLKILSWTRFVWLIVFYGLLKMVHWWPVAITVLGSTIYLICNNTRASMEEITRDPKWLNAQVPFAELSEAIRPDPLEVSSDHTKFFKKVALN